MSIESSEILRVSPDGDFMWHEDADRLIKEGDFTHSPALPHILRRLRQHDEMLEALKDMLDGHEDACTGYGEGAADKARAAIAKATGGEV